MKHRHVRLALLAAAPRVMAEESGHAHETGSPSAALFFSTVNLLIFIWILARFVMPPVRDWVRSRRARVVKALEEAAAAKAEALRLRQEWEARLAQFTQSVEEMRAHAQRDIARERDHILESARKTADAIRRDAELAAAYELRRTQEQLRAELVRQAVQLAEQAARTQLSAEDQQRFVAEFLKQVEP